MTAVDLLFGYVKVVLVSPILSCSPFSAGASA